MSSALNSNPKLPRIFRLAEIEHASPIDWGRWAGAIFAMAPSENRDGSERIISSGFFNHHTSPEGPGEVYYENANPA